MQGAPLLPVVVVAAPPVPLAPLILPLPLLLPLLPPPTPSYPLRPDVCIVALPNGLIVVFFYFVRPPARLPRCARCSAASFVELPDPWPPHPRG